MTGTTLDHLPEAPMLELLGVQLEALKERTRSAAYSATEPNSAADLARLEFHLAAAYDAVNDCIAVASIYCDSPAANGVLETRRQRRAAAATAEADAAEQEAADAAEAAAIAEADAAEAADGEETGYDV